MNLPMVLGPVRSKVVAVSLVDRHGGGSGRKSSVPAPRPRPPRHGIGIRPAFVSRPSRDDVVVSRAAPWSTASPLFSRTPSRATPARPVRANQPAAIEAVACPDFRRHDLRIKIKGGFPLS